jgi:subfamily B ATP-binding cassette protein MsbA
MSDNVKSEKKNSTPDENLTAAEEFRQKNEAMRLLPLRERRRWKWLFRYERGEKEHQEDEQDKAESPFSWRSMRRFLGYVRPYRGHVVAILLCICVTQASVISWPKALGWTIDHIVLPGLKIGGPEAIAAATRDLLVLGGVMLGIFFVYLTALGTERWLVSWVNRNIVSAVRIALHKHLQRQSVRFIEDYRVGRVVSRIMSDTESLRDVFFGGALRVTTCVIRLVVLLSLLLWMDWRLTLISCVTIPLFAFGFSRLVKKLKPAHKEMREDNARAWANASELFSGIRVAKAFTAEKREDRSFANHIHTMMRKGMLIQKANIMAVVTWEGCARLGFILVMCVGGYRVLHGDISVGTVVAFYTMLGMMFQPVAEIVEIAVLLQHAMACLERVFEVLDTKPEIQDRPGAKDALNLRGRVEFDHVDFDYGLREGRRIPSPEPLGGEPVKPTHPTLTDVTFTVEPGESVAFVGSSGAGKSTMLGLLARFYDVNEGAVKVDGTDVRDYRLRSYRRCLAMVLQDTFLFGGTIRENIAYGRPRATEEEIIAAAKAAGAWDFICAAEKGLDSPCGERGVKLSGGQKQRIAIARAFLTDPRILLLDEATSALDSRAEAEIQDALDRLMHGRTTFIVAHRLSTIVHVNRIFVIDGGRIVESGSHEELLQREGKYYELFMEQYGKTRFSDKTVRALQRWRDAKKERQRKCLEDEICRPEDRLVADHTRDPFHTGLKTRAWKG